MTPPPLAIRLTPPLTVFACSLGFLFWATTYEGRAEMMPVLTGWFLVVMSFLDILANTGTRVGDVVAEFFAGKLAGEGKAEAHGSLGRTIQAMAWPGGFVAGIVLFGFFVAIPVYVFLFMLLFGKKSLRGAVTGALATTLFMLVVFEWLLDYEVFRGLLFGGY